MQRERERERERFVYRTEFGSNIEWKQYIPPFHFTAFTGKKHNQT